MVQEYTTPPVVTVDPDEILTDAVFRNADADPDHVLFSRRSGTAWVPVTSKEFASQVRQVAAGLIAKGVGAGDRVAIMSRTRYEWTVIDYAIWTAGGVTVPIYETSSAEQVEWIISDSGTVLAIVETPDHAKTVAEVKGNLPDLGEVLQIDGGAIDVLVAAGASVPEADLNARRDGMTGDTLATIIYTSGTTGRPKGCEIDHGAFLFDVMTTTEDMASLFDPKTGSTLMFLPLAHVFGRIIQCGCVTRGVRFGHTADIKNLLPDLAAFQPTFLLSVPRVFEKVYNSAKAKAHGEGKGKIFDAAEGIAIKYSEALDAPGGASLPLRLQHTLFDKLVYSKLRAAMGGKVEFAVSGGAPLGARLGHFFRGIGVNILEGYGLTETSAGATVNAPGNQKVGSVGRPVPGVTIRIADDGEILIKGRNLFRGYWKNEAATKEAITDGWFHTGDIGNVDKDGFLPITGRKKELIVTAGGKNVAPAVLEDRMRAHPLISQVMVVGDKQPFIAALVTIDAEALPAWCKAHGKPESTPVADLCEDAQLRATVQEAVDDANKAVSKAEAIKAFVVLPDDFTEANGMITPSLKVKRAVVADHYAAVIEKIYSSPKD